LKKEKLNSVQEWLPFCEILENGIIKLKDFSYVKIIKVYPINFNLKSNLEKEAILNSYKLFLKTCDFNIQILVQSNKEDLSKHISDIKKQNENEQDNIISLSNKYINYIQKINHEQKSSCKNFYILIKNSQENKKENIEDSEKIIISNLNDQYFKIKECLSRCGNIITDCNKKNEIILLLKTFYQSKINGGLK